MNAFLKQTLKTAHALLAAASASAQNGALKEKVDRALKCLEEDHHLFPQNSSPTTGKSS